MTSLMILDSSVDYAVSAWLAEKYASSGSERTRDTYARELERFRRALHNGGWELTSDRKVIRQIAQAFAEASPNEKQVQPGTHNLKLAILSSFYEYCVRNELCGISVNPIDGVKRRKQQRYSNVLPLEVEELTQNLKDIDRTSVDGKRDYAILLLALMTGRRIAEVASLTMNDLTLSPLGITIVWRKTKGGKVMRDKLPSVVATALLDYINSLEGHFDAAEGTIWKSLSWNGTAGASLRPQALRKMCGRRLGTTNFHRLRHTFAFQMEQTGAKVSDIQKRLGHSNIGTTGLYLESMATEENEHAPKLLAVFDLQ